MRGNESLVGKKGLLFIHAAASFRSGIQSDIESKSIPCGTSSFCKKSISFFATACQKKKQVFQKEGGCKEPIPTITNFLFCSFKPSTKP